jgi:hypothetical protein
MTTSWQRPAGRRARSRLVDLSWTRDPACRTRSNGGYGTGAWAYTHWELRGNRLGDGNVSI